MQEQSDRYLAALFPCPPVFLWAWRSEKRPQHRALAKRLHHEHDESVGVGQMPKSNPLRLPDCPTRGMLPVAGSICCGDRVNEILARHFTTPQVINSHPLMLALWRGAMVHIYPPHTVTCFGPRPVCQGTTFPRLILGPLAIVGCGKVANDDRVPRTAIVRYWTTDFSASWRGVLGDFFFRSLW